MSKLGRANVEAIYPLSPLQEGMLFHSLYEPGSDLYVNRFACRLAGADPRALRGAWERLVARHPILRTTFLWQELERPLQVVHREVELPWRDLDWTDADPNDPADDWRRRAGDLLASEDFSGFDLARPPLERLACARLAGGDLAMVWSHHHILLDGWSLGLLLAELLALHDDLAAGREPSLPPARGFGDFISWLERRDDADAEATWRRHLEGFAAATALPFDRRAGNGSPELAVVERVLAPAATGELEALVRRHRLTLSTLVQAAWGLLLARHAGSEDVAFGVTVAGRPTELPGAERIAGLFINTLPVRLAVPAGETVGAWLTQVQERLVELRRHEHLPLVRVQGWSEVAAGDPLFESVVVFENYPGADEAGQPGGATVADVLSAESTHYPLTLQAGTAEGGEGTRLALKLAHDRRRVDDAAAAELVGQLSTLLAAMAADDGARLADLPLTPPAELAQTVAGWNATARPYAVETTLSARIEAQA
ncbi:MAG TPA: condensation domain-containing protein, partial [Thermoanaerobaculia bacterium]|nr:condensation domain-containing protein [Thermoanaerobaculia bacterium]